MKNLEIQLLVTTGLLMLGANLHAGTLSDPSIDSYNVRLGTQTFGSLYKFTTNTMLVETAQAIRSMGSDVIKFYLGSGFSGQYGITLPATVTNLMTEAKLEPSCRAVFDMPFRHFFVWANCFNGAGWYDGVTVTERTNEYNEIYALSRYLLTNYNGSGKSFYLGHWEGDWLLLTNYDATVNPSATRIQGMIDWLNARQQAVDDAMRSVTHTNVHVYLYTEVNRVRDAMVNGPANNQRLVNTVLPFVTNMDFVSWSSYDGQGLGTSDLYATLNYIEANISTNKASVIAGKRVFVGEYGWGKTYDSAGQELPTRNYMQQLLPWGVPFVLFWEMYNNETNKQLWLIDRYQVKTPCYYLHQNEMNENRLAVGRFKERNGRLPTDDEFEAQMANLLGMPLLTPVAVTVANAGPVAMTTNSAAVAGTLRQNFYGDELARVRVFWGTSDGGASRASWQQQLLVGTNTSFNPSAFAANLTSLGAGTNYFRFYATNAIGEFWAPASTPFVLSLQDSNTFGWRMKLTFTGHNYGEPLANFPVLVQLSTNLPGFNYRQFASPAGGDLRFAGADGRVPFLHEIDEWNTNGTSLIWVRVPLLSATNDSIWVYWGNPAAATPPAASTNGAFWSFDHELVWHLKESAPPYADSTGLHPAMSSAAPASTSLGVVGRGAVFSGAQFLDAGAVNCNNDFTLSAWVKVALNANNIQALWCNKSSGFNSDGFSLFVNSYQTADQRLAFEAGDGVNGSRITSDTNVVPFNQWEHVAVAVNRTNSIARIYVNGLEVTGAATTMQNNFRNFGGLLLGSFTNSVYKFNGTLDEVRINRTALSSGWLRANYLNIVSNGTFATVSVVSPNVAYLNAATTGGSLQLMWPGYATGYTLYSATNLTPPVVWLPVTNSPVLAGAQWQTVVPVDGQRQKFYRLQAE